MEWWGGKYIMTARAGNYIAGGSDHFYSSLPVYNSVLLGGYYSGVLNTSNASGAISFIFTLPLGLASFNNISTIPMTGQLWPRGDWK